LRFAFVIIISFSQIHETALFAWYENPDRCNAHFHRFRVQTFAYLYRLARPNTIPIILSGGGRKLDLPSIDALGACDNGIDLLIANDCTMVYNRLGLE
jgi:hypothetical protein